MKPKKTTIGMGITDTSVNDHVEFQIPYLCESWQGYGHIGLFSYIDRSHRILVMEV